MAVHEVAAVRWANDGNILVKLARDPASVGPEVFSLAWGRGFGGAEWSVFTRSGEFRGMLRTPGEEEVTRVRSGIGVGYVEEDFGVQHPYWGYLAPPRP